MPKKKNLCYILGRVEIDLNINEGCDKIVLNANKFTYIKVLALTTNTIKRYTSKLKYFLKTFKHYLKKYC